MANATAVGDYIIVEKIEEEEKKSKGGIIVPSTAKSFSKFKVLGVGPKVKDQVGLDIAEGATVLCYRDLGVEWDGKFIVPASQILAVL